MSCRLPQVFDHPSVAAITSYISSLGIAAGRVATAVDSSDDESDGTDRTHDMELVTSAKVLLSRSLAVPDGSQATLIGISSLASKTAASNTVMKLPGVDASRRVPFSRWELDKQDQVSVIMCMIGVSLLVYASGSRRSAAAAGRWPTCVDRWSWWGP